LRPATLTLPAISVADAYPLDWLQLQVLVSVMYPANVSRARRAANGRIELLPTLLLPVRANVDADPGVGRFSIRRRVDTGLEAQLAPARIALLVQRPRSTIAFVFMVLLAPLLLALASTAAALGWPADRSAAVRDLLIGLTAATVAVLPLRAVLVPAVLEAPTFVDWCLAAELLILVGLGLLGLRSHRRRATA
jgi:hypothetical protein